MAHQNKLDSLPASDHKYFKDAEVFKIVIQEPKKCDHYFKRVSGLDVECDKCRMGYMVDPGMYVKDGHIYVDSQIII